MTWTQEFGAYAIILGLTQLSVAWRFYRLMREQSFDKRAPYSPSVSLIVPCKGTPEGFETNVRSLLDQLYEGKVETIFVTPTENDAAFIALKKAGARVLASQLTPTRSSGKAVDLLFALDRVSSESAVVAFADADIRVEKDWLAQLVAPLADPSIDVSSSAMLYVAHDRGFWSAMRAVWMAAGIPYYALMDCVTGQSFAMRRADFDRFGVRKLWSDCLMEDMSLAAQVRRRGGRIHFASRAIPISEESCDLRGYFGLFNKWLLCFRVYDPFIWLLAMISTFAHVCIVFCSLAHRPHWGIVSLLFAGDIAYLAAISSIFARYRGVRPFPFWVAFLAPFLWATYAIQLLNSLLTSDVHWGGRVYRLHAPNRIEVLN